MNPRRLASKLLEMRQEITALKTARTRGLGVVDFFVRSITIPYNTATILGNLTATAEDGQIVPFFVELAFNSRVLPTVTSQIPSNNQVVFEIIPNFGDDKYQINQDLTVTVISSAKLNLTWEAA